MEVSRRNLLGAAAAATALPISNRARAQAASPTIRIGVLNDQSGPYRDISGMGSVAAARQAIKDFGDHGFAVDVIFADHQNKPDVGAAVARQWCDTADVDLLLDLPNSAVALAVNAIAREKNKVLVTASAATTDLTGPQCSPNTVQWTFDVYMLSKAQGTAIVKQGGDTCTFSSRTMCSASNSRATPGALSLPRVEKCSARPLTRSPVRPTFPHFCCKVRRAGRR